MAKSDSPEAKILAGARAEFCEFGLRGARMQSIADRCGVNKALLHYYFRSKELLYKAVLQDIVQTMRGAIELQLNQEAPEGDIRSLFRRIITVYIRTLQSSPDIVRFVFREIAEGGAHLPDWIALVAPSLRDIPISISRRIEAEANAGTLRRVPPLHLFLNILGMCLFTFIAQPILAEADRQLHLGIDFDDSFFDVRIETILDMVMHGCSADRQQSKEKI